MFKPRHLIFTAIIIGAGATAGADTKSSNVLDLKESITDPAIVYPETFEENTQKLLESWYIKNYTTTDDRYSRLGDVETSDATIQSRLAKLPTLIDMPFNQIVRTYIDRYTKKARSQVAAILGLGTYYLPIFEQALEAQGLPLELKYLPIIESGLDPNSVSKHGATGLWQLMLGTGKGLGLEVNSLVDERRDPYLSSEKAAGYLKDLYDTYGDWTLAIAAYNCGPGTVNKALRRAGGDPSSHDFWSIYKFLPEETRGYVPMFIAANYVMNYYPDHNISPVLPTKPLVTDTVAVRERLHFNQISEVLNIPVEELRILNPQFRADIIPATTDHQYFLILPSQQVQAYLVSEDDIIAHDADKYARRESAEPGDMAFTPQEEAILPQESADDRQAEEDVALVKSTPQKSNTAATSGKKKTITHKVAAGETLASIAQQYNVDRNDVKEWNNLRRNAVRTGQQLRILVDDPNAASTATAAATPAKSSEKAKASADKTKASTAKATETTTASTSKKGKNKTADTTTTTSSKKKKDKKQAAPKTTTHDVTSGESLERIAKREGVSVDELRKANPQLKSDVLHPGDKLTVPAKASSKSGKASKSSSKSSKSSGSTSKKSSKKKKK